MQRCFYCFNIKQDKYISHEEFAGILNLTDYHVDNVTQLIRSKLLRSFTGGGGGTGGKQGKSFKSMRNIKFDEDRNAQLGKTSTQIKENRLLSNIFNSVNLNKDGVLSQDEVQDLCIKLHIYVTDVEAAKILQRMDMNGDDRVEESDFINFVQKEDDVIVRKATRVRDAASQVRNYFKRRTAHNTTTANKHQMKEWNDLKRRHEVSHRRFPGYLNVEDMMLLLAGMGLYLSPVETYDVVFAMALDKNGKIYPNDLDAFASRSCRSVGELTALLERDVMAPVLTIYRLFRDSARADDEMVKQRGVDYQGAMKDILKSIQDAHAKEVLVHKTTGTSTNTNGNANTPPTPPNTNAGSSGTGTGTGGARNTHSVDVVSVSALKRGFEDALKGYQTPDHLMPNLEEYVCLATVVGAEVASDGFYGIKVKEFVEGLCVYVAGDIGAPLATGYSLDLLCRDLRKMILEESVNAAYTSNDSKSKGDLQMSRKNPDFIATFNLFDQDHNGNLSINEFKDLLLRLQLVDALPQEQLPSLLQLFDKNAKGHITCDDFISFVRSGGTDLLGDDDGDSVHSNYEEDLLQCQSPPVAITQNADCDFLAWQLWRQSLLMDSQDPESIVTDIETACCDVEIAVRAMEDSEGAGTGLGDTSGNGLFPSNPHAPSGYIAKDELWQIVKDVTMSVGGDTSNVVISRSIFEKGVTPLMENSKKHNSGSGSGSSNAKVDYESLCKHVIRMGRAFNVQVQTKNADKEKKYIKMKADLFHDMLSQMNSDGSGSGTGAGAGSGTTNKLSKYEKVFRRLDHNGDGKISYQEFKDGLKRIRFKDQKHWTVSMIRRLFSDMDEDHDGDLSIAELTSALRSGAGGGSGAGGLGNGKMNKKMSKTGDKWYDSDDESSQSRLEDDDFLLFSQRKKTFSEYELYRKIFDILLDTIPANALEEANPHIRTSTGTGRRDLTSRVDTVGSVVRKLFKRSDADGQGFVSEERFLSFCRRSELSVRLSTVEMRRLIDKLRRTDVDDFGRTTTRNLSRSSSQGLLGSASARKKNSIKSAVNYEL